MTEVPAGMLDWDTLTVGDVLGPFVYDVSADRTRRLRAAIHDHTLERIGGVEVAPPALLTFAFVQLVETWRAPRPGTVHASQELELLAPVRVGALLTVTGVLVAMYLRRGRRFFQIEASAVDDRTVEVARSVTLVVYPEVDVGAQP